MARVYQKAMEIHVVRHNTLCTLQRKAKVVKEKEGDMDGQNQASMEEYPHA